MSRVVSQGKEKVPTPPEERREFAFSGKERFLVQKEGFAPLHKCHLPFLNKVGIDSAETFTFSNFR